MEPKISDLLIAVSKAESRIKALEDVVRELVKWGDYDTDDIQGDWPAMRAKALELLKNGGK